MAEKAGETKESVEQKMSEVAQRAKETWEKAQGKGNQTLEQVQEQAREIARQMAEKAGETKESPSRSSQCSFTGYWHNGRSCAVPARGDFDRRPVWPCSIV